MPPPPLPPPGPAHLAAGRHPVAPANHLAQLRQAVADGDGEAMERTFTDAKAARDAFTIGGKEQ